jgi:hypothetical protein
VNSDHLGSSMYIIYTGRIWVALWFWTQIPPELQYRVACVIIIWESSSVTILEYLKCFLLIAHSCWIVSLSHKLNLWALILWYSKFSLCKFSFLWRTWLQELAHELFASLQ